MIQTIAAKTSQKGIITEKLQYLIESTSLKPVSISYHLYTSTENKEFLFDGGSLEKYRGFRSKHTN